MATNYSPRIVTDSITCYLDAANPKSYPGSGTTIYDLTKNNRNSTIIGSVAFSTNGYFNFDGTGERDGSPTGSYISLNTAATTTNPSSKTNGVTYQWWMKINEDQPQGHGLFVGSGTINHLEWRGTSTAGSFRTEAVLTNGKSFGASGPPGGLDKLYWHNIAIVFANDESGGPVRWYRNGELFYTGSMFNRADQYFQPTSFGKSTGSASYLYAQSFYGSASSWLFYDRKLTETEIKKNFQATRGRHDYE
jgi:hypothetical protein